MIYLRIHASVGNNYWYKVEGNVVQFPPIRLCDEHEFIMFQIDLFLFHYLLFKKS